MKNFLKITGIVLLVVFAASCSNGLLQTTFNNEANDNGQCLVSFSITDILPHSRTIMPDNLVFGDIGYYEIEGTSTRGKTLALQEVDITDGKGQIVIDYAPWTLTLHAYDNEANKNELLRATTFVDLTYGAADIKFKLKEDGVTTQGSMEITVEYPELTPNEVDFVSVKLVDKVTNEVLHESKLTAATAVDGNFSVTYDYEGNKINPGDYGILVELVNDGADTSITTDDRVVATVPETVQVSPGRQTTGTITITEDQMSKKPNAPTGVMAYLKDDSEDAENGTYTVQVQWVRDALKNESHYAIEVHELANVGDTLSETTLKETYETFPTNTSYDLTLDLGKLYEIQVYAVNGLGESDKTLRESATGTVADHTAFATEDDYRINRYMIKYDLNGGTYNGSTNNYVDYKSNSDGEITLIDCTTVTKDTESAQKWIPANTSDENTAAVTTYTGSENYFVKAVFTKSSDFEVELPDYEGYDLTADRISCTVGGSEIDVAAANTTPKVIDVSTGEVDIVIELKDGTNPTEYDASFKVTADDQTFEGTSCTINTSILEPKVYNLLIQAREKSSNKWYSYTIQIKIVQ
ncbi:fibronectin type III domain-containing protein [bacterium]|nr:fibronectin type III domain-containing protein [bacterium]